jgi:hypothetical protein
MLQGRTKPARATAALLQISPTYHYRRNLCVLLFVRHFDNVSIGCDIKFWKLNYQESLP